MSSVAAKSTTQKKAERIAVTLVIDNSGSMAQTDPQKLRERAADIFIDHLSPEDYLGIITFHSEEEVIIPIQEVKDTENKNDFKKILSHKLENVRGHTDYLKALHIAGQQLDSLEDKNIKKIIVLLTDGDPDPDGEGASQEYMTSLEELVNSLAIRNYCVYSVGFSTNVDPDVLAKISENTQGKMGILENPEEIAPNFEKILEELKNPQEALRQEVDEHTEDKVIEEANIQGSSRPSYILWRLIGLFIMLPPLMILAGWIFYKIYASKYAIVTGQLLYKKVDEILSNEYTLDFKPLKKEKIIITFDENKRQAEYYLPDTDYKYDIEIYIEVEKSKWKFVDGWKAALKKGKASELILNTSMPGIFIYEGKAYSKKKLYSHDKFTSGGYEFEYVVEGKDKKKGKNILEGMT